MMKSGEEIKNTSKGSVVITVEEYESLLADSKFLLCLEGVGVDNWQGYDDAVEMMNNG